VSENSKADLAAVVRERFGDPATAERERPGATDTPEVQAARQRTLNAAMKPRR
jgi:hypothetical protein